MCPKMYDGRQATAHFFHAVKECQKTSKTLKLCNKTLEINFKIETINFCGQVPFSVRNYF